MALHLTGSDRLLEINTASVDVVIESKGKPNICVWATDTDSSSVNVAGADLEKVSIPVFGISEEYDNHKGYSIHDYAVSPLFFEQTDYIISIRGKNGEALQFDSYSRNINGRVKNMFDDPSLLSGVINFRNNVGFSDFHISANGRRILSVRIEVYPTKISYKEDYQAMMADINNMVSESILDFMKKTYQLFDTDHKRNGIPAVFFTILEEIYQKFIQSLNRIIAVPHHKLVTEHEVLPHYKAVRTDVRSERWLCRHPEYIRVTDKGFQTEKILSVKKKITYDTQENRLVKFMLRSTIQKIEDFTQRYVKTTRVPDDDILSDAGRMCRELRRFLTTTFLAEVSENNTMTSMSLVFGMAPGYRELYKYYLMLQNGISVGGDIFHMSVRDTAQLYEYWCFIKLYDILRSRYTLDSPDIIQVDRRGVTINLVQGDSSKVTFLNTKTGEMIYLSYNPSELKTQTVNQRPDNVLELQKKGANFAYKYVFDAKYRIEMNPDEKYYPDTKPGPKVDDINTMHRYRDSIVYENPESRFVFEKTMFGAYILFPYENEKEYKEHRFYKSIETVNIGGLPFLPSATSLVTELLDELVSDSPESAFERATLPVGIEDHLKEVEWDKRDVLIGLVPDEEHKDLFLKYKMYFTRKFDMANLPVRYVALYEKGSGILWYGEIISWRKERRRKLPGRSRYGNEQYHVFDVLKWHQLTSPIAVSEYGPNPIAYTNYFLLENSSIYSELLLKNEADYRFFTELKRRTNEAIIEGDEESTAFEFGEARVLFDKSNIYLYQDGKPVEMCTVQEFSKHPNATFRRLQKYAEMKSRLENLKEVMGKTEKFVTS